MAGSLIACLLLRLALHQDLIEERTGYKPAGANRSQSLLEWAAAQEIPLEGNLPAEVNNAPFVPTGNPWKILEKTAQAGGGRFRIGGQSIRFIRGQGPIAQFADPFWRVSVESIVAERSFENSEGKLTIGLNAAWHPRLGPILIQGGVFTLEYEVPLPKEEKEKNAKRKIETRPTSWIPIDQKFNAPLELTCASIPRSVQRIDLLQGEVRLVAPERLTWIAMGTLEEPGNAREQKVGKTLIRRVGQKIAPNRISLEVEVKPGPSSFFLESYQESALIGPARITLPSGEGTILADGYTSVQNENGWMRIRYDWLRKDNRNLREMAKGTMEVRLGDNFKELLAKVSFRDLPLP